MSVSTTTDRVAYSGNGATVAFSFGYVLYSTSDLKVYLKNNTTGAETLQTITTHYTISGTLTNGVYESGVTVTFLTAPTASQTVIIYRDRSVTQELELDENGKIPSASLEKQLDKLTTYVQRVKNKLARSVGLPEGFTATFTPELPPVMVNDGYLKTNTAGDGFEYISEEDLINTINTSASTFTASRALVSDANGLADVSAVTATELGYVSGVTGQLSGNAQSATLENKTIDADSNTITNIENADIKVGAAIDAAKIADGSVSNTEFQYINSLTSNAQTQLNAKINASFGIVSDVLSFTDQGSDPSAPSAGYKNVYAKSGGMFVRNSAGTIGQLLDAGTVTTKGDLIAATGSGAVSRLAAGTNNHALIADSAQSTGLKYANIGVAKNILKTTSGTKTPSATNHYHSLTSNSISLAAGTWELTGYANFSNSGSPSYTDIGVAWWGANGADSSSTPTTALSGVSGLTIDSAYGGGVASYFNLSTQACQIQAPTTIVTLTTTQTIYIVTYATMTTAANARITAYMTARQLY